MINKSFSIAKVQINKLGKNLNVSDWTRTMCWCTVFLANVTKFSK